MIGLPDDRKSQNSQELPLTYMKDMIVILLKEVHFAWTSMKLMVYLSEHWSVYRLHPISDGLVQPNIKTKKSLKTSIRAHECEPSSHEKHGTNATTVVTSICHKCCLPLPTSPYASSSLSDTNSLGDGFYSIKKTWAIWTFIYSYYVCAWNWYSSIWHAKS